uniref:Uncharacterized protein n=1 Tax=Rhizophagus irregularis (strain DAOM 181602 / DAOM 197198 / MUCL 43194) TaxID=747089 RepID=U9SJZ1_RHIID
MEIEVAQTVQRNDITEFAHTISNPISIRIKDLELNEGIEEEGKSKLRWCEVCEVCNREGHNARTCSNKKRLN